MSSGLYTAGGEFAVAVVGDGPQEEMTASALEDAGITVLRMRIARHDKSLLWAKLAALVVADAKVMDRFRAQGVADDRAWVNELQPGRKRTRSNGEAQWKREQRTSKRRNK